MLTGAISVYKVFLFETVSCEGDVKETPKYLNAVVFCLAMQVGIVGKANVGKSTFFKAATLAEVEIANYPFATINPNTGVGYVKVPCVDKDLNTQCNPREGFCIEHNRFVPVQMIDVAGLVPGAHEGKGMGNQFLDDLNQADVLIHVVDAAGSTNEKGEYQAPGSNDPINDIKFLEIELDMWYLGMMKKVWERFSRQVTQENLENYKAIVKQFSGLGVSETIAKIAMKQLNLEDKKISQWSEEETFHLAQLLRKMTKPMIIAANKIDVPIARENLKRMQRAFPEYKIIGCSGDSELALREAAKHGLIKYIPGETAFHIVDDAKLSDKQKAALAFIKSNVLDPVENTGVQHVLDAAVFELLKYIAIFPGGVHKLEDQFGRRLPDCFLMPPGTTALSFAFRVHTDLGTHFIRAIDVRTKMAVGKEHPLKHRDVIEIVSGK